MNHFSLHIHIALSNPTFFFFYLFFAITQSSDLAEAISWPCLIYLFLLPLFPSSPSAKMAQNLNFCKWCINIIKILQCLDLLMSRRLYRTHPLYLRESFVMYIPVCHLRVLGCGVKEAEMKSLAIHSPTAVGFWHLRKGIRSEPNGVECSLNASLII